MKRVWKFPLEITDEQVVEMPRGAYLLSVGLQPPNDIRSIQLWALVNPDAELAQRTIVIHGTGHPVLEGASQHVGTAVAMNGALVWHVFDGGEKL